MQAYRAGEEIPPDRLEEAIHAFSSALRDRVRAEYPLPDTETITYEVVTDKPWSGFNYYLGDYRSTVAVNADLKQQMSNLPRLVAHESYPGHHTEHCRKEAGLVEGKGQAEQTIFLVNTPQCLMAEGLADLALHAAIGPSWGGWAGEIYADLGLRFDGERAEAVSEAAAALADVRQDAALMLHDEHRDVDDVVDFLKRWLLVNDERARQMLRFLSSPLWRAYTSTYVEGYRLLRGWLEARPDGVSLTERFGAAAGRAADPVVAAGRRLNRMTADSTVTTATAPGAEYADTASAAYRSILQIIESVEPRIAAATRKELADQRDSLKLIASENYASPAALLTMGSWLSDKYAEGTIGHRFYAGCQNVDTVETVAAEHARELFGSPYAYVQPHSGIDANLVAYWAILATRVEAPGLAEAGVKNVNDLSEADWEKLRAKLGNQRLLGMSLDAGGHLTHGFRPNISGKMFHQRSYGTDPETGLLDYDALAAAAREFKPLILVGGYSAYPRRINFAKLREIADEVGATLMVDMAHFAGLVAGKVFTGDEDPVPHAHVTTTTTHKSLRGPRGGLVLATSEYSDAVDKGCPMVLGGPLSHVMAAKAVALAEARQPAFQAYAQRVADNAKALAEGFLKRGARLVTGGTDNHIVLLDVTSFGLTGRQAESALLDSGVVTNRNSIPADPNGAWYTSGIRFGTPALTTRGFGADDFDRVAELMVDVLSNTSPEGTVQGQVQAGRRHRRAGARRRRRAAGRQPAVPRPHAVADPHREIDVSARSTRTFAPDLSVWASPISENM